jgi:hypothetical protein
VTDHDSSLATSSVVPQDLILISVDDHICEPPGMFQAAMTLPGSRLERRGHALSI